MVIPLADKLVKGALCVEVMQRSEKPEGTKFYNYERKEHFIYKVQRPWSNRGVRPTKQSPASSTFSQTLRTQRMGLFQCLPEDALISHNIQRRKICFLLMSPLGEVSLQIFCGFIKLNQKESLNRSIALGNYIKSQLASLSSWGTANLPSSPLVRLTLFASLAEGEPMNLPFAEAHWGGSTPGAPSSPVGQTKVHVLSHQTQRL